MGEGEESAAAGAEMRAREREMRERERNWRQAGAEEMRERERDAGEGEDAGEAVVWRVGPLNGPYSLSPYFMTPNLLFFSFSFRYLCMY